MEGNSNNFKKIFIRHRPINWQTTRQTQAQVQHQRKNSELKRLLSQIPVPYQKKLKEKRKQRTRSSKQTRH